MIKAMKLQIPYFFSYDRFPVALIILGSFLALFFTVLGPVHAQGLIGFYTNLTGREEVPPINTTASGLAVLLYNNESSQLSYLVNVTGLEKISDSRIHNGTRGINGDVVIPLKGNETADKKELASILFQDDMKVNDLQGPLEGKKITDLVKLMSNESAYVNILTERNPGGEIRGQLNMGQIQLDPSGSITGLMVPGGVVKLTGVILRNGVVVIETTRTIGFVPAPGGSSPINTGGVVGGVTSVVGELGGVVGKVGGTVNDVANIIDASDGVVGNVGGTVVNTVDNAGGTVEKVGGTVQKTGGSVEQASSAVVETVDDTGNTLGNTVEKIDDGVVKKILIDDYDENDDSNGDSKDSNDDSNGDSKDSDDDNNSDDDKDDDKDSDDDKDDDDGHSLKDTVKKLLS
jgi:hypothetical protein